MNITGKLITYTSDRGVQIIAKVTNDGLNGQLLLHSAVDAETLQPVKYRFGGRYINKSLVKVLKF